VGGTKTNTKAENTSTKKREKPPLFCLAGVQTKNKKEKPKNCPVAQGAQLIEGYRGKNGVAG